MKREELEKTEEYDFVIRFKSNKPKYEVRSYIINHILDEFDNLQMWDFKRSSEFAEPREERIADLEAQIEKMKSDVKGNIKWADENKNNQMYFKLNAMFNKWEIKENE